MGRAFSAPLTFTLAVMRKLRLYHSLLIACALALPPICSASDDFFATLTRSHSSIKWDKSSLITADFNGDKITDRAVLGYKRDQVVIAISMGRIKNGKTQLLPFSIGASIQAAICALPATLGTEPLACTAEDGLLPGCKEVPGAQGLFLSGGECDSVHLYWNHRSKRMEWWRL